MCLLRGTDWIFIYNSGEFLPRNRFSPISTIPPKLHIHLHLHTVLTSGTKRRSLPTFHKAIFFRKSANIGVETIFTFFLRPKNFKGKRKKGGFEGLRPLRHGRPIYFGKRPNPLLRAGWLAARVRITMRGTYHRPNYCVRFMIYT